MVGRSKLSRSEACHQEEVTDDAVRRPEIPLRAGLRAGSRLAPAPSGRGKARYRLRPATGEIGAPNPRSGTHGTFYARLVSNLFEPVFEPEKGLPPSRKEPLPRRFRDGGFARAAATCLRAFELPLPGPAAVPEPRTISSRRHLPASPLHTLGGKKHHLSLGVDTEILWVLKQPSRNLPCVPSRKRGDVVLDDLVWLLKHPEPLR